MFNPKNLNDLGKLPLAHLIIIALLFAWGMTLQHELVLEALRAVISLVS